jgi:anti-sigma factor RsiW
MRTECPSEFVLDAAYGDALDPSARRALEEHLRECPACASRRQLLARQRNQFLRRIPETSAASLIHESMPRPGRPVITPRSLHSHHPPPAPRTRRLLNIALLLAMLGLAFALWTRQHEHASASRTQLDALR